MDHARCRAYAKINLSLDVLGKLPTGYHVLNSVLCPISLYDDVAIALERSAVEPGISCECLLVPELQEHVVRAFGDSAEAETASLSSDANLAAQAASAMLAACAPELADSAAVKVRVIKRIPWRAGLGGGSSNAAAVIALLSGLIGLDERQREAAFSTAASLGSDVPAMLLGRLIFIHGTGNKLASLQPREPGAGWTVIPTLGIVLLKPLSGVETGEAYRRLGYPVEHCAESVGGESPPSAKTAALLSALGLELVEVDSGGWKQLTYSVANGSSQVPSAGGSAVVAAEFFNEFENVVLPWLPETAEAFGLLQDAGSMRVLLAGSGSTAVGFFESFGGAAKAAERLKRLAPEGWFVEACRLYPWGPSAG